MLFFFFLFLNASVHNSEYKLVQHLPAPVMLNAFLQSDGESVNGKAGLQLNAGLFVMSVVLLIALSVLHIIASVSFYNFIVKSLIF